MRALTWLLGRAWDARAWRHQHARLLWSHVAHRSRNREAGFTDDDHLRAAAQLQLHNTKGSGGSKRLDILDLPPSPGGFKLALS